MKKKLPILTFTSYITSNITLHVTSHFISRVISRVILGVMLFGFFLSPLSSQESRPVETGETIIETVTVQNVEIPVRVFKVKQPVEGLQKTDFQLYINGKEHKISGFYQLRKKLDLTASPGAAETAAPHQPRLFVLIFNFSDYRQDLASLMDYFFSKVVQPGDRVMAITNHYFFPEWKADAPGKTKSQVLQVLQKEVGHLRKNMKWFENELKSQSSILKSRIADSAELLQSNYPAHIFKDFFLTYRIILDDIKTRFLEMPVSEYIKMADYIKSQPGDKWVFNFFQPARIPLMDNFGYVRRSMDIFINFGAGSPSGLVSAATLNSISSLYLPHLPGPAQANTTKLSPREILINPREMARHLKRLRFNYSTEMKIIAKDYLVNDISKFFLNSGATFHTMLLKPMNPGFSEDYKYQSVTTDAETILKKLSHLTGGSVVNSNRIEKFVEEVAGREDIVYMLAYVPDPAETGPPKVRVTVNNPKYRVVFDNQKRAKKFRSARKKLDQKQPDLVIERLLYQNEQLAVKMKNIKMVNYDGKTFGALQTRVHVKDKNKKTVAKFTKTYRGIKKTGVLLVKLPNLDPGRYDVVLEVKDLFSMDNKYVGDAIHITQK